MASWISAAISFVVTPIVTRLFVPDELGRVNMFITFLTFFQTLSILSLDQAYMRFYHEKLESFDKEKLFAFCMRICYSMAFFNSILLLLFRDVFSNQIVGASNVTVILCLILTIFSSVSLRMNSICARMENNVVVYTIQVIGTAIVEKVLYLFVALKSATHLYAIVAITLGYFILALFFQVRNRKLVFAKIGQLDKKSVGIILKFAIPYLPVLLLAWLNNSIPQFFLKNYVDYSAIGIYTNAVTIANILTLIQTGFSAYWGPFAYEHYKTEGEKLRKVSKIVTLVVIMMALGVILFQDVIYLILGEKYRLGRLFFAFLLFTPVCNTIADTTGIGIMLSQKSYLNIFTFLGNSLVNILLCLILIPQIGNIGAGIAAGTSAITMLVIRTILGNKYYKLVDNYSYIIISMLTLYICAIVSWKFSESFWIRSAIVLISMLETMIVYRKEEQYLWNFAKREVKNLLKIGGDK